MQVRDRLAAKVSSVQHQAVTVFREAFVARDFGGREEQVAEQGLVMGGGFGDRTEFDLREYEDVVRGLRVDVADRGAYFVVVQQLAGDFAAEDFG